MKNMKFMELGYGEILKLVKRLSYTTNANVDELQ